MSVITQNIMNKIYTCLEKDVSRFDGKTNLVGDKKGFASYQKQQREFVKYLVSVATHPIGLRASVKPYNCCQEDMLLYLMDMFDLSEAKLRAITIGKSKSKFKQKKEDQSPIRLLKRHSWRPQLKIRIHAPAFYYKEQLFLNNLYVRVFLIDGEKVALPEPEIDLGELQDAKSKGVLRKIFKRLHPTSSNRIRSLNEIERVVKFDLQEKNSDELLKSRNKSAKSIYRMTQLLEDGQKIQDDVHVNIRRYYCEPQYSYIVRFEFWLNSDVLNLGCIRRYQRCLKNLTTASFSKCSGKNNQSTNLYRNQDFYGFINIKLANLPSYATKQTYPILSLQGRKVNNCEISLELRNRRILEENDQLFSDINNKSSTKRSIESFLINHVRLYFNCILYQCLSLTPNTYYKLAEAGKFRNITLDNLFYLPGYTLINQHRLQSNLSRFEDQCLRRASMLILLTKLENSPISGNQAIVADFVKTLLISLIQNEYATAHILIDDKTLQEVDPFQDGATTSTTKKIIARIELKSLRNFLNVFLIPRLDHWLPKLYEDSLVETTNRTITLLSLKLFKTALVQLRRRNTSSKIPIDLQTDFAGLRSSIEKYLCLIIINHIRMRMEMVIHVEGRPIKAGNITRAKRIMPLSSEIEDDNKWLQLLHDLRYIQHDLTLYWSRRGLNSLVEHEQAFVKGQGLFENLEKMNLSGIVETKLETYLRQ